MSLYDRPLPRADYAAYRALRAAQLAAAATFLLSHYQRQENFRAHHGNLDLKHIDLRGGRAQLDDGSSVRLQFLGYSCSGRWRWAWEEPELYAADSLATAQALRARGSADGIEWLSRSGWPVELPGQQEALLALALAHDPAAAVCCWENAPFVLGAAAPAGLRGYDHIYMAVRLETPLPPPTARVLKRAAEQLRSQLEHWGPVAAPVYAANGWPEPEDRPLPLTLFPEAAAVFSPAQPWLAEHFLPLLSFELADLDPALGTGPLHLLKPLEPEDGCIGEDTPGNDYCGVNWFTFRRDGAGHYELLTGEDYFVNPDPDAAEEMAEVRRSYEELRDCYRECGLVARVTGNWQGDDLPRFQEEPLHLMERADYGNWACIDPPPAFRLDTDDEEDVRLYHREQLCRPILWSAGYSWGQGGADAMLLFYEPVAGLVIMTFDYT